MQLLKALRYQRWSIFWTLIILVLCCMKMPESNGSSLFFIGFDKMVHLGFFFVLTVLLFYGKINYQHNYNFRSLTIFKIILICAFIGGGIEFIQWQIFTYRSAELWDFICDMLGCFMGIFSFILLHRTSYHEK